MYLRSEIVSLRDRKATYIVKRNLCHNYVYLTHDSVYNFDNLSLVFQEMCFVIKDDDKRSKFHTVLPKLMSDGKSVLVIMDEDAIPGGRFHIKTLERFGIQVRCLNIKDKKTLGDTQSESEESEE